MVILRTKTATSVDLRSWSTVVAGLSMALSAACSDSPLAPVGDTPPIALAKPPSCPAQIDLTVSGLSGSLLSDGQDYADELGVASHTSGANGNLMFNVQQSNPPRTVTVTTSQGPAARSTRIFTNNHEQSCGLAGMPNGSGTAVIEVEWSDATNRYTLRYGKNCVGDFGTVVPANKIATSRAGNVWTLSGGTGKGILCRGRLTGKPNWTSVGTGDAFTMTLTGP